MSCRNKIVSNCFKSVEKRNKIKSLRNVLVDSVFDEVGLAGLSPFLSSTIFSFSTFLV